MSVESWFQILILFGVYIPLLIWSIRKINKITVYLKKISQRLEDHK